MEGGDLLHRLQREKRLSVDHSRYYFRQLCRAVKYLHDLNITHRDIKPGKITRVIRFVAVHWTHFYCLSNFRQHFAAG